MAASPFAKFLNNIIALVFPKNFPFFSHLFMSAQGHIWPE